MLYCITFNKIDKITNYININKSLVNFIYYIRLISRLPLGTVFFPIKTICPNRAGRSVCLNRENDIKLSYGDGIW